MKVAFICAMPEEFRAVARHVAETAGVEIGGYRAVVGSVAGHEVLLIESGMGFVNAAGAAQALLAYTRPDIIVSAGFCGGIAPELEVGDVAVATRLVVLSGGNLTEVPVELAAEGYSFIAMQSRVDVSSVRGGYFVSTPIMMEKSVIAALLPAGAPNPVVEMEGGAIALVAAKKGIPFAGIRSVSDPSSEELGFSLEELCDNRMRVSIPRVFLTIVKKPRIIPQLVRLAKNSRIAEASLGRTVRDFLDFL